MTGRERVLASVAGQPVDRRPVAPLLSLYGARLTSSPLEIYYRDPEAYAAGQRAVREAFAPDLVFGPFAIALLAEAFGGTLKWLDGYPPNLARPAAGSAGEALALPLPDLEAHPTLRFLREAVRATRAAVGETVAVAGITLTPVDLPIMLLGIEGWLEAVLLEPEASAALVDRLMPFAVELANGLAEAGADVLLIPAMFLNPSIVTRSIGARLRPGLVEFCRAVAAPKVLHSGGAPLLPFLEVFLDLPGVVGYVVNPGEDLVAARRKVGPAPLLAGNIDGPGLASRGRGDVLAEALAVLDAVADDPRIALATSAADVLLTTPPEVIAALREAAEAAGCRLAPARCVACSALEAEIEALRRAGRLPLAVVYTDSLLHMRPSELHRHLLDALEQADDASTVLVFGDCCAHMGELAARPGVARTAGHNCIELLLGRERYREERRRGAFFLTHEWALRWREVLIEALGTSEEVAREILNEQHTRLLYLDTGLAPRPEAALAAAAAFTGLPVEILEVGLDQLAARLAEARAAAVVRR